MRGCQVKVKKTWLILHRVIYRDIQSMNFRYLHYQWLKVWNSPPLLSIFCTPPKKNKIQDKKRRQETGRKRLMNINASIECWIWIWHYPQSLIDWLINQWDKEGDKHHVRIYHIKGPIILLTTERFILLIQPCKPPPHHPCRERERESEFLPLAWKVTTLLVNSIMSLPSRTESKSTTI